MFSSNQMTPEMEAPLPDEMTDEMDMGGDAMLEAMMGESGEVEIDPMTGEPVITLTAPVLEQFGDNLAQYIPEDELDKIGSTIKTLTEDDKETRKEWYDTLKKGLQALGVYSPDDTADTGIERITHPMLLEAATQFQARAMAELLPPGGPVKASIVGQSSPEIEAQGQRVADHMNYQLTVEDRTYYDQRDQMLFLLAFTGSEFDKQFFDPVKKRTTSRWVRCDHFIVPYNSSSLEDAPRYAHEIHMSYNDYKKLVAVGFYMDDDCCGAEQGEEKSESKGDEAPLTEQLATLDGQEAPAADVSDYDEVVLYESHIDFDLPGYEDMVALPYIITIKASSGEVVGIRRNWKETDESKTKRIWFSHKKFLPGFGFYGFGFLHCIGNLGEAATEVLRILLDSGAFATLQGGFKSKDCRLPGSVVLEPGKWIDTEMTAEELARSFYTPPFKEASPVMFQLLGMLVTAGQKFAATTETMTGDAATTGPVGTMVAQIEQGSKVFSGIHKRLHKSFGDEFLHIAEINGENLPEAYPYEVRGGNRAVLKTDYDGRVDVIPVSDPNIFSSAQRIALAQTVLQLAISMPDLADRREAAIGLLVALRYPDPDKVFPKPQDAQRMDPVAEGSMVILGKPVKAFLDQAHQAHIMVHQMQMQHTPQQFQASLMAHVAEHMAMAQYVAFAQQMQMAGQALPPLNFNPKGGEPMYPQLPPQVETAIAMQTAQMAQQMLQQQQQQLQAQQAQQAQQQQQGKEQIANAQFQADQKRKDVAFQADQQRKDAATQANVDREDALAGLSPQLIAQAKEFIDATGVQMSPRELAVLSKALGKPFVDVVTALSRMMMAGQGGSQFQQTADLHTGAPRFS